LNICNGYLIDLIRSSLLSERTQPETSTSNQSIDWCVGAAMGIKQLRWRPTSGNSLSLHQLRNISKHITNNLSQSIHKLKKLNSMKIHSTISKWKIAWILWNMEIQFLLIVLNVERSKPSFRETISRQRPNIYLLFPTVLSSRNGSPKSWMRSLASTSILTFQISSSTTLIQLDKSLIFHQMSTNIPRRMLMTSSIWDSPLRQPNEHSSKQRTIYRLPPTGLWKIWKIMPSTIP